MRALRGRRVGPTDSVVERIASDATTADASRSSFRFVSSSFARCVLPTRSLQVLRDDPPAA